MTFNETFIRIRGRKIRSSSPMREGNHQDDEEQHQEVAVNEQIQASAMTVMTNDNAFVDHIAKSTSCNRRLWLTTILMAITVIGTSVLTTAGSDVLAVESQPKPAISVDVNGPPTNIGNLTAESRTTKKHSSSNNNKSTKRKFKSSTSRNTLGEGDEPFLVVENDDDQVPTGIPKDSIFSGASMLHASDALECRESVINFVINATDGKDECDGLKRAFDKTCNSDTSEESVKKASEESVKKASEESVKKEQEASEQRRRVLFEASQPDLLRQKWQVLVFQTSRWIQLTLLQPLQTARPIAFFAEDEVSSSAWQDAQYLVENGLDKMLHKDLSRRLRKDDIKDDKRQKKRQKKEEDGLLVDGEEDGLLVDGEEDLGEEDQEEPDEEIEEENTEEPATKEPKVVVKTKQSLTLPTSNQHMSETMLSETLLLQKEDTIKKAIETAANQTNATLSEAAVDAAASSKAVQDTSAAVSAVLNDPTSVEARTCCASILNVFHENCDTADQEEVSDKKLFLIVFVLALCGMVKSLIRHFQLRWLPEAAGCILVGVICGVVMSFVPHYDISFDGDWFLRILVPPIVFEAALSINKQSFNRHVWPIMIYAVVGTLLATGITAYILHKGTSMIAGIETIPYVESLTFGALISSIDPIAVLSVLNNIGMTDSDSIYVVIFGESLLNDGVALVLFQTLVHFLDESLVIDQEAVIAAAIHFLVVAFGSLCVGIGSGFSCTVYYWLMQGCQTPLVEVLLFFCWAFIPYYICDGIGWSGIVAVVATGFIMDIYVVGQGGSSDDAMHTSRSHDTKGLPRRSLFTTKGHLSSLAKTHVGFVAELLSTMMETAIFAYLGVFLFSYRYHWNFMHTFLAIFACCISRAIMIPLLSLAANWVAKVQQARAVCHKQKGRRGGVLSAALSPPAVGVVIDNKMQLVLWVAGLRGAMSFALVENIPLYDTVTGQGSRLKPELKAMTSATIVFTVFILGGYTYYLMEHLGMKPKTPSSPEMTPLVKRVSEAGLAANNTPFDDANDRSSVRHRPKDKLHG